MAGAELASLIEERESELSQIATGLAEGNAEAVAAGLAALVAGVALGSPALTLLAPFLDKGVRVAFANTATARLQRAAAELDLQDERAVGVAAIAKAIEALLGQALIQLVRVQHRTHDEVVEMLGGLRKDLADFREDFQNRLADSGVRIDAQRVRDGATGVRISDGARAQIWIGEQTVSGAGAVGIDVLK